MGFKMKGFPMQGSASALKQTTQASPMKVAGGIHKIDYSDPSGAHTPGPEGQLSTEQRDQIKAAGNRFQAVIDDPNSTQIEKDQAHRNKMKLHGVSYSGINQYNDPNSKDFIPELEGMTVGEINDWKNKNIPTKKHRDGGTMAANPEQQELLNKLEKTIDWENTTHGESTTRRQEMLDNR